MSDFSNILNYNDYQQQQYSLMDCTLFGLPHDESPMQNISKSGGYGSDDDSIPWDPACY